MHKHVLRLVQNPTVDDPPNAGLSNKADYKGSQKKQFGNYRWISCQDPSLLDAERCEFILIGATEDLQGDALSHCAQTGGWYVLLSFWLFIVPQAYLLYYACSPLQWCLQ